MRTEVFWWNLFIGISFQAGMSMWNISYQLKLDVKNDEYQYEPMKMLHEAEGHFENRARTI